MYNSLNGKPCSLGSRTGNQRSNEDIREQVLSARFGRYAPRIRYVFSGDLFEHFINAQGFEAAASRFSNTVSEVLNL
jgi:hypothetical protein